MIDLLAASHTSVNITGDTLLHPVGSCLLPANLLGLQGEYRINLAYSHNNSVGNKTISAVIAGVTVYTDTETTASLTQSVTVRVRNRAAQNAQLVSGAPSSEFQPAAFAGTVNTTAVIDFTRDQTLQFFIQLANGADNMSLDSWSVDIARLGP